MSIDINYRHSATNTDSGASTLTFTGVALGPEAADREIIIAFGNNNEVTKHSAWATDVTVNGVPMTKIGGTNLARLALCSLWQAFLPAGTTATVVVTKNTTDTVRAAIGVWSLTGRVAAGAEPLDLVTYYASTSVVTPGAIEVAADGALVVFIQRVVNGDVSFTGPTEDFDISASSGSRSAGASMETLADNLAYTVGITVAGGGGRVNSVIMASFGEGTPGAPARKTVLFAVNEVNLELIPPVEGGESETFLTIPSGKTSADLVDFVVRVDLADLGSDFWDNVTPGGENIRIFGVEDDTQRPVDVIHVDRTGQTGEVFFKTSISADFDNEFVVRTTLAVAPEGVDAPYGRHAVWSGYEAVFMFTDAFNRCRSGADASVDGTLGSGPVGWLNLGGAGSMRATVAKLTSWTMGATIVPGAVSANAGILSYGVSETGDSNRASLMIRPASSKFGLWNSSDTWLVSSGAAPAIGTRARVHHTYATTTNRKIYQAGVQGGNDNGVSQRPGGAGNTLFIGAEDASFNERVTGRINYVYLRPGELPAAWIAAEYASWENSGFYNIV